MTERNGNGLEYQEPPQKPLLSSEMYDALKWLAQIALPAVGALYFGLAQIWGLPRGEEVVGSITVVDAFLGVLLGVSNRSYDNSDEKYDGVVNVVPDVENGLTDLNFRIDPTRIETKDEILVKVNTHLTK